MNRRTFLAGLATTTAIVAAGGVPAPARMPNGGWGQSHVTASDIMRLQAKANGRLRGILGPTPYFDAAALNARWMERLADLEADVNRDMWRYARAVYIETDDEIIYRDDEVSLRQLKRPVYLDADAVAELTRV